MPGRARENEWNCIGAKVDGVRLRCIPCAAHCSAAPHSALLLVVFATSAQARTKTTSASSDGVVSEGIVTTTVIVTAVDQSARIVTVKSADRGEMMMAVSDEVKRLDEVKVCDELNIGYLPSVGLEFRTPTEEEFKEPFQVIEQSDKAAKSRAPAAAAMRTIRAVVSVEGISRWLSALTVKGPLGNYFVVEVDPASVKWEELRIGQQMVGTYTEAVVLSIEPAAKK